MIQTCPNFVTYCFTLRSLTNRGMTSRDARAIGSTSWWPCSRGGSTPGTNSTEDLTSISTRPVTNEAWDNTDQEITQEKKCQKTRLSEKILSMFLRMDLSMLMYISANFHLVCTCYLFQAKHLMHCQLNNVLNCQIKYRMIRVRVRSPIRFIWWILTSRYLVIFQIFACVPWLVMLVNWLLIKFW